MMFWKRPLVGSMFRAFRPRPGLGLGRSEISVTASAVASSIFDIDDLLLFVVEDFGFKGGKPLFKAWPL